MAEEKTGIDVKDVSVEQNTGGHNDGPIDDIRAALDAAKSATQEPSADNGENNESNGSAVTKPSDAKADEKLPGDTGEGEGAGAGKGVARSWAAIKNADKKAREERETLKRERNEFASEKAKLDEARRELAAIKEDPIGTLEKLGITANDLLDTIAKGPQRRKDTPQVDPDKEVLIKKIESLEQKITKQQEIQIVNEYKKDLALNLKSDKFLFLQAEPDALEEAFDFAAISAQNGTMVTPMEALEAIQEAAQSRLQGYLKSEHGRKYIKDLLGSEGGTGEQRQTAGGSAQSKQKTLTNLVELPSKGTELDDAEMSEEDEIRAAAKLISPEAWKALRNR